MLRSRSSHVFLSFLRPGLPVLLAAALFQQGSADAEDRGAKDPLEAAGESLYINVDTSIAILENAVQKTPKRVDCWSKLLSLLNLVSSYDHRFLTVCTSRAALAANPGSPELLHAQAQVLDPSAALDVLDELGRIPGHEEEALDAKDMLLSEQWIPQYWWDRDDVNYVEWVGGLIARNEWDRAGKIIRRAVGHQPKSAWLNQQLHELHGLRAMVLAEGGDLEAALAEQRLADFPLGRVSNECPIWNLGELLLLKSKPELAIASFGGILPTDKPETYGWLVLGQARLLAGDARGAETVFTTFHGSAMPDLLRIADLVRRGRIDEARATGQRIFDFWNDHSEGTPDMLGSEDCCPKSLRAPLSAAVVWLIKEFPDRKSDIEAQFGTPSKFFSKHGYYGNLPIPCSKWIPDLERRVAGASLGKQWDLRAELARALQVAERYDDAAAAIAPKIFMSLPDCCDDTHQSWERFSSASVEWTLCKRRAESVKYFKDHPERIISVRQTIYKVEGMFHMREPPYSGYILPPTDEVAARLTAMGPGILALVDDAIEPNAYNPGVFRGFRTPFVRVVENIGSEQDTPVLIDTLAEIVHSHDDLHEKKPKEEAAQDAQLEAAIHRALEKLTHKKNTAESSKDRLKFWAEWWDANARRIVLGTQPAQR